MKIRKIMAIAFCALFLTTATAELEPQKHVLTFGVVPQQSAGQLARTWGPILK